MRPLLILAVLAATAAPVPAASLPMANGYGAIDAPRDTDPLTLGQLFCAARIAGDMSAIEPYFAAKLVRRLAERPPNTPVQWQTFADHPASCGAQVVHGADNTVGVLVEITYEAGTRRWADTLNFERTPASWRLNNVFFAGGGNLRFRLMEQ